MQENDENHDKTDIALQLHIWTGSGGIAALPLLQVRGSHAAGEQDATAHVTGRESSAPDVLAPRFIGCFHCDGSIVVLGAAPGAGSGSEWEGWLRLAGCLITISQLRPVCPRHTRYAAKSTVNSISTAPATCTNHEALKTVLQTGAISLLYTPCYRVWCRRAAPTNHVAIPQATEGCASEAISGQMEALTTYSELRRKL